MTGADEPEVSASALMERLQSEASRAGDPRRVATLARLVEACDAILSGVAFRQAKSAKEDPAFFQPGFVKLNSRVVEHYVRLRARMEKGLKEWTGPVGTTIRGDRDLMLYLKLRQAEVKQPGIPRKPKSRANRADAIVDGIADIHDQALLREAIAAGRETRRQLNILVEALRKHPEVDVDALREGKYSARKIDAPQAQSAVGDDDVRLIKKLVARLQDNGQLDEFDLVYRSGRVKMSMGAGLDLVYPEELKVLERIAGLDGSSG